MAGWTSRRRRIARARGLTLSSAVRHCSISATLEQRSGRCAKLSRHPRHFQIPLSTERWKQRADDAGHSGTQAGILFMGTIKFGTDGWRAVIAEDFTFSNLERVAQATADYWSANPVPETEKRVIVGYDRRFLSDEFGRRTA